MGVRDRAPALARDQADPRHVGCGRLGARPGRARPGRRAAGGVHEAAAAVSAVAERLAALGVTLPRVTPPLAAYVPALRTGSYVYVSGQVPVVDGVLQAMGKVGAAVSAEEAYDLARTCA